MPRAPQGLGPAGRRLWRSVLAEFELSEHERVLLQQSCRVVDELDAFAEVIAREGVMAPDGARAHPAVVESRQLRLALTRLLATLRMPAGLDEGVPQHRGGARGAYGGRS